MEQQTLILASASPRRIQMLLEKGLDPVIIPAGIVENLPFPMEAEAAVMYLALKKALSVEAGLNPPREPDAPVILAADTVVYHQKIIGKPKNKEEAFAVLSALSGNRHSVITGVALLKAGEPVRRLFYQVSEVFFKPYSEEELTAYVNTPEPYDKAGGYAIQGTFQKYVDHIEGDVDNVIGLPWGLVEQELKTLSL